MRTSGRRRRRLAVYIVQYGFHLPVSGHPSEDVIHQQFGSPTWKQKCLREFLRN
ncbi:MAG TPA: hypothetical protein VL240_04465 [Candidatus Binatia bacterium]|nr:hypothetical protein [Candidatus Binatia bacterium]